MITAGSDRGDGTGFGEDGEGEDLEYGSVLWVQNFRFVRLL